LLAKAKEVNSIVSFQLMKVVPKAETYERLTMDELKKVHALMARDLSEHSAALLDQGAAVQLANGETVGSVLTRRCFIAQPVALNSPEWVRSAHKGCIRIALSAPHVSDIYEEICRDKENASIDACVAEKVRHMLREDEVVFEKLILILTHWGTFVQ
jgi:hypothetical protein